MWNAKLTQALELQRKNSVLLDLLGEKTEELEATQVLELPPRDVELLLAGCVLQVLVRVSSSVDFVGSRSSCRPIFVTRISSLREQVLSRRDALEGGGIDLAPPPHFLFLYHLRLLNTSPNRDKKSNN